MPARRSFTSQQKSKDRFLLLKSNRISKVKRLESEYRTQGIHDSS